jgi:hypothetical protein
MAGITNADYSDSYTGIDATGPYPITFDVILDDGGNASDIEISVTDSSNTTTDITSVCTITGKNVYTTEEYDDTNTILIYRQPAFTQPYDVEAQTILKPRTVQKALNRLLFLIHRLVFRYDRFFKVPVGEPEPDELPDASERASKYFAFDADGQPQVVSGTGDAIPTSDYMKTVLDDTTAVAARITLGSLGIGDVISSSTTPYTMTSTALGRIFLITTGASAFVFNIASAATILGQGSYMVIKVDSGAGVMEVKPNSTDAWANAGNVSCYLSKQWQSLTFTASSSGKLSVLGGVFVPNQTRDTNGTQIYLGKLIHLALDKETTNVVYQGIPPVSGAWSGAFPITGSYGIPTGAKGIRAKVFLMAYITSTGEGVLDVIFSDNASYGDYNSPHPNVGVRTYSTTGTTPTDKSEIDIPLNSNGELYWKTTLAINVTTTSSVLVLIPVGYYMGV